MVWTSVLAMVKTGSMGSIGCVHVFRHPEVAARNEKNSENLGCPDFYEHEFAWRK